MAIAVVLGHIAPASAGGDDGVHGLMTHGSGEITGRVLDEDGRPVARADVHVVSEAVAEHVVKTSKDGTFRTAIAGAGSSWVFVRGTSHIDGAVLVSSEGHGEIVEIHETIPPAVMPRPRSSLRAIPAYSEEAIDRNTWTRAWLVLDVDEAGRVGRLKLLASPGLDLDAIAIREGFKLRFKPGLDRAGNPTPVLLLWVFEWPAYYWLLEHNRQTMTRMPDEAAAVPCRGTGPTRSTYRDCSHPDLSAGMSQPWLMRPTKN